MWGGTNQKEVEALSAIIQNCAGNLKYKNKFEVYKHLVNKYF